MGANVYVHSDEDIACLCKVTLWATVAVTVWQLDSIPYVT